MKYIFLVFVSVIALLLNGCSSLETKVISGTADDIKPYQSFFWANVNLSNVQSPALLPAEIITADGIIKNSVTNALQAKGYQLAADQQSADMLVDYRILITEQISPQQNTAQTDVIDYGLKWKFGNGQAPTFSGWKTPDETMKFYQQGNIYIGFFDAKTDQRLWVLHASEPLNDGITEEEWSKKVTHAVKVLLKPVVKQ